MLKCSGNLYESNDQKEGNCYICNCKTKTKSNYCMFGADVDNDSDEPCDFVFKVCKEHKGKRNKIFQKHLEEHNSVDLV